MPLPPETRLGPYEIRSMLGVGGMGEVYRARDTRLDRDVAIKVLPAEFALRADLKQRFEREARAISSLHHPHICALYDIGHQNGTAFLVMELLEGEPLDKRIARGALPLQEALSIAIQIADALDKAHHSAVIHRDLKPANVMLTEAGAKLLDFGLAKSTEQKSAAVGLTALPTQTQNLTTEGTIIGTVAYMAPEQLEGKEADPRTDIFAFGALLYEMLTGRKAFSGESHASLIASIMSADPAPVSTVQPMTVPALERAIRKCLAKSPEQRWQSVRDLKSELQWIVEGGSQTGLPAAETTRRPNRRRVAWAVAGGVAALVIPLAAIAMLHFLEQPPTQSDIRFDFALPPKAVMRSIDIPMPSPDGSKVAFSAMDSAQRSRIWIRALNSPALQSVPGTEDAVLPFWSPDGRQIGFVAAGKLKKVDLSGGPAQTICDVTNNFGAATWNREGVILFGRNGPLFRVSAQGGEPKGVLELAEGERTLYWPQFLPDGDHFLYNAYNEKPDRTGVYIAALSGGGRKKLMGGDAKAIYAGSDYVLFNNGATLYAQPFDTKRMVLKGEAIPVGDHLLTFSTSAGTNVFASLNGVLAYRTGVAGGDFEMAWFDRVGKRLSSIGSPAQFTNPALSPDEKWLAVGKADPQTQTRDLWLYDLSRGTSTRLTFDSADDLNPAWSPDGRRIAFTSDRKGKRDIYITDANGTRDPELVSQTLQPKNLEQWSPDGKFLLFNMQAPDQPADVHVLKVAGDRKAEPYLSMPFAEDMARVSPNGRWIAYRSNESGTSEIYVQTFNPGDTGPRRKWRVSTDGGLEPQWRADGKELFYLRGSTLMAVDVKTNGEFEAGLPKPLFDKLLSNVTRNRYIASRDGQKFLVITPPEDQASSNIHVIVNWPAILRK